MDGILILICANVYILIVPTLCSSINFQRKLIVYWWKMKNIYLKKMHFAIHKNRIKDSRTHHFIPIPPWFMPPLCKFLENPLGTFFVWILITKLQKTEPLKNPPPLPATHANFPFAIELFSSGILQTGVSWAATNFDLAPPGCQEMMLRHSALRVPQIISWKSPGNSLQLFLTHGAQAVEYK